METQQPCFQQSSAPAMVFKKEQQPPDVDRRRSSTYRAASLRGDGPLCSLKWCLRLVLGSLDPRVVMHWDTARTCRRQAASLSAKEELSSVGAAGVSTFHPRL